MFTAMMTWLSLLNQEISSERINAFCAGCSKNVGVCTVYADPTKLSWFRNHQQCAFNFRQAAVAKKTVNALKASKRAAKGA
jgi:Na+-translocating ferredoxin:NAD+ oxidoreductase RnfC subunit